MKRSEQRLLTLACVIAMWLTSVGSAQVVLFSYEQTDKDTGSGFWYGSADGIYFSGAMPAATVTQNDLNDRVIPAGMVGYMDGASAPDSGNPYGVHLGWSGTAKVLGERTVSPTVLELYELDVDLVIGPTGTPEADWAFSAEVTDDDGAGNDAFGAGLRIAGWLGDPQEGHRHSGSTQTFVQGQVDRFTMGGTHNAVDANGRGDNLGIGISFRNGPPEWESGELDMSGPVYVDSVSWQGGLDVDLSKLKLVGMGIPADFDGDGSVGFSDFLILRENFNNDGTVRKTGDLTGDGRTDLFDFAIFRQAFATPAGAASVPEPLAGSSLALGALLTVLALRRQRS